MTKRSLAAIVPAAGMGTRMKSSLPKFLHELCGRSVITHIMLSLENVVDEIIVVVGNGREMVELEIQTTCASFLERITFVEQAELLGSGHATKLGMTGLTTDAENIIVVLGDMPLLTESVLGDMADAFLGSSADVLVSTAMLEDPIGYGRIIRDENKIVKAIVEEKDCDDAQHAIKECNMYPFVFTRAFLDIALDKLDTNNSQGEQYLTDVVAIARESSKAVTSYTYPDARKARGANDRAQLSELEFIMRETINTEHMQNGVTMTDPATTYIDAGVTIAADVTLLPGTILQGTTSIATGCVIGPDTRIVDSSVGEQCVIESSTIKGSTLENDVTVGPYASLRPGTMLHAGVHIGTFVETKNSEIGQGSKVPHLSYLGDATVGKNANLGAGTITANFDGANKHATVIGDGVKTGVNTVLVAPVTVGKDSYTGAGAVVTKDVPEKSLAKGVPAKVDEDWTPPKKRS